MATAFYPETFHKCYACSACHKWHSLPNEAKLLSSAAKFEAVIYREALNSRRSMEKIVSKRDQDV